MLKCPLVTAGSMPDEETMHAAAATVNIDGLMNRPAANNYVADLIILASVLNLPTLAGDQLTSSTSLSEHQSSDATALRAGRGGERLEIGDASLRGSYSAAAGCAVSGTLRLPLCTCVHVSGAEAGLMQVINSRARIQIALSIIRIH